MWLSKYLGDIDIRFYEQDQTEIQHEFGVGVGGVVLGGRLQE